VAELAFDRTSALVEKAGDTAMFIYDVSASTDPDGDPIYIKEFFSNGTSIGSQSDGFIALGPGKHQLVVRVTDGHRSALSSPVLLVVTVASCKDTCGTKKCGVDACGNPCGECAPGSLCKAGACVADECVKQSTAGCCGGPSSEVASKCINGAVAMMACVTSCGWDDENQTYACGFTGADPSGKYPKKCGGGGCVPKCAGKECGDDGCGGKCGVCQTGSACSAVGSCGPGMCVAEAALVENLWSESTLGTTLALMSDCVTSNAANPSVGIACIAAGTQLTTACAGCFYQNFTSCSNPTLLSKCTGLAVEIFCKIGSCTNKECGDDGCGGSCGECKAGLTCYPHGKCLDAPAGCLPGCAGDVTVPAGPFWMGCNDAVDNECLAWEKPYHTVNLGGFSISRNEVTNSEFAAFLSKNGNGCDGHSCAVADDGGNICLGSYWPLVQGTVWSVASGFENHPVQNATWYGANTYCSSIGKRLCTEAEWEKAARGTDGRKYPWGNSEPTCNYSVYCEEPDWNGYCGCGLGTSWPVGSKPQGASAYGVLDMSGNVGEWVADWWSYDDYTVAPADNPTGPATGSERIIRGGDYGSLSGLGPNNQQRCSHRSFSKPTSSFQEVGVRCCHSVP